MVSGVVKSTISLTIVIPCYNEREVLPETHRRLMELLHDLRAKGLVSEDSRVCYVDDGSRDGTWSLIEQFATADARVQGIKLSRNQGHQLALLAGLLTVTGDAAISIDADLQDDISVIPNLVQEHLAGAEVVYAVRDSRAQDTLFKRTSAAFFYRFMRLMGVELLENHADYRLLGRQALEALRQYREVNLFLRGIVPLLGFPTAIVKYDRSARFAGASKYPLRKMLSFAWEGITSFSILPLRIITLLGFLVSLLSFGMILYILYGTLMLQAVIPGWASTVVPVYFLGGIQLLAVGILGEYLGKIYLETKARPKYIIEKMLNPETPAPVRSKPLVELL